MATTAVVAGTATATAGAVANRQHQKHAAATHAAAQAQTVADLQQQVADLQTQQVQAQVPVAPAPIQVVAQPVAAPAAGADLMAQLQQLAHMREAGLLSDDEFTAAKTRILGG